MEDVTIPKPTIAKEVKKKPAAGENENMNANQKVVCHHISDLAV
jgi:hypothetical protein